MKLIDPAVNFTQYNRILFVMPNNGACSWAGVANIGCPTQSTADGNVVASRAWQMASSMGSRGSAVQLTTHGIPFDPDVNQIRRREQRPQIG